MILQVFLMLTGPFVYLRVPKKHLRRRGYDRSTRVFGKWSSFSTQVWTNLQVEQLKKWRLNPGIWKGSKIPTILFPGVSLLDFQTVYALWTPPANLIYILTWKMEWNLTPSSKKITIVDANQWSIGNLRVPTPNRLYSWESKGPDPPQCHVFPQEIAGLMIGDS